MSGLILVTGGTGTLGRHVVELLRAGGHPVRVLSRHGATAGSTADGTADPGVRYVAADLATGDGVAAAVAGASTVLHLAGSTTGDDVKTAHLIEAARDTVDHLVYISVVGADLVPVTSAVDRAMFGYYAAKRASELLVERSGLPWTTLRATQFHELVHTTVAALARMPVVPYFRGAQFQPVAARDVAKRLVELALAAPAGLVPDVGGPRAYPMEHLVRDYLRAVGLRRPLLPMAPPGGAFRAIRDGANLAPEHAVGRITWEEFLAERYPATVGA
ncbi:NAD(P)H-binding protein [Antribacter sp. KLBMP9083]|uniref:NAD(P)H-binding protein n=1 Tax=Antribacter soli TaxID=2910976 RepID=A0AA41QEX2_9MICO|nr:NAD(P)H-binding protein [Antribacter soli]MCF4121882.1 NAD(P)H-binding protein [Antribacter soli]